MEYEKLVAEVARLNDIITKVRNKFDEKWFAKTNTKTFDDYRRELIEAYGDDYKRYIDLSGQERMTRPVKFSELSDIGDRMSLTDFIENVEWGGFIDSDGMGSYIKDNQESNIELYPSDIARGLIRQGFTEVVWYNK